MKEMDAMSESRSNNKMLYIAGGLVLAVLVGVGLVFLARGSSYTLTVQNPEIGPAEAPVVIEEFADFQCPACKQAAVSLDEVLEMYPTQVKLVYRDFPIPGHAHARLVAAAGLCAAQQDAFSRFYKTIFEKQDAWAAMPREQVDALLASIASELGINVEEFNTCRESRTARSEVDADANEGVSRGVTSTPTFFINGEKQVGVLTVFQWIQRINGVLEQKGLTPENAPQPGA